ncbi:hypothetical protein [Dyadobacter sp. NIV53]|uniref:hypothetical protein n=1 Tax=Dyadobacter sp. NIV53 TaxID=2861765 RepID=UPI001C87F90B|nr:hypothetical protein [Dyadobacter sp. NIV53]
MYSSKPGLLIGFHGCDESVRDDIVLGRKNMLSSKNDYDWLGKGYYFGENNYERALDFAHNPPGKTKIAKPAVLGAIIDLQNCLDLLEMDYLRLVQYSYQSLALTASKFDLELPINRSGKGSKDLVLRNLDCAVIENLHHTQKANNFIPFDSVRGVFVRRD